MEYARFERLVVGGTALLVLLALAAAVARGGVDPAEIVAQLLLVAVLAVAVHWGRKAGTISAGVACLLYLAVKLPSLSADPSPESFWLILSHFAAYCLVGILGGEVFGRLKYQLTGSKDRDLIDDWSRVYNQRYAAGALAQAIARSRRYQEPFSMVVLRLEPVLTSTQRPEKLRGLVRSIASFLRDDVRMVDDVARLDDGRFVVLLPHTPGNAANMVAGRLTEGVCRTLGVKRDCVSTTHLSSDEDGATLEEFAAGIAAALDGSGL